MKPKDTSAPISNPKKKDNTSKSSESSKALVKTASGGTKKSAIITIDDTNDTLETTAAANDDDYDDMPTMVDSEDEAEESGAEGEAEDTVEEGDKEEEEEEGKEGSDTDDQVFVPPKGKGRKKGAGKGKTAKKAPKKIKNSEYDVSYLNNSWYIDPQMKLKVENRSGKWDSFNVTQQGIKIWTRGKGNSKRVCIVLPDLNMAFDTAYYSFLSDLADSRIAEVLSTHRGSNKKIKCKFFKFLLDFFGIDNQRV